MRFSEGAHAEVPISGLNPGGRSMRTNQSNLSGAVLLFALVMALPAVTASAASDEHMKGAMILTPATQQGLMASGAVEDTLKACVGRIPSDATIGQRLLAEQSCAGQQQTRQLVPEATKF